MFDPEHRGFDIGIRLAREIAESAARQQLDYDPKKDAVLAKKELDDLRAKEAKRDEFLEYLDTLEGDVGRDASPIYPGGRPPEGRPPKKWPY